MEIDAIIYDLDDTLYVTQSTSRAPFAPFFEHLAQWTAEYIKPQQFEDLVNLLWTKPIDEALQRYPLPINKIQESLSVLEQIKLGPGDLSALPGLELIPQIHAHNLLVTTGIPSLQMAKIDALGVSEYFREIHVDNPLMAGAGKQPIFKDLLEKFGWSPQQVLVVGDNPSTELLAAYNLHMSTVQVAKAGTQRADIAQHYIRDFFELQSLTDRLKGA